MTLSKGGKEAPVYSEQGWEFGYIGNDPFGSGEVTAVFNYVVKNPDGTPNHATLVVLPNVKAFTSAALNEAATQPFDYRRGNISKEEINKAISAFKQEISYRVPSLRALAA